MPKQTIDNAVDGPPETGTKCNANFTELYESYRIQIPLTTPGGVINAGDVIPFDFPDAGTVTKVDFKADAAPTVSGAEIDLKKAAWGSAAATMLNANLSLGAGSNEANTTSFADATVTAGQKGEIEIAQADSGGTCGDALVIIHFKRT